VFTEAWLNPLTQYSDQAESWSTNIRLGWLDERACLTEALLAIARAGADVIFTYAALDYARWCREG